LALNDTVDVWVSDLYRAARLVVKEAVPLEGVPLLRLRADPSQGDPDPRFFQSIRGLMNVTTPTAGPVQGRGGEGSAMRREERQAVACPPTCTSCHSLHFCTWAERGTTSRAYP
jgi:hypothetical protein